MARKRRGFSINSSKYSKVSLKSLARILAKSGRYKKFFELKNKALNSENGEYVLGYHKTGCHACYMIYGILKTNEKRRLVKPGKGHAEIVLAVKGDLKVTGYFSGKLKEGSAFYIEEANECFLENKSNAEAIYIIAGGHTEESHH